ncbi:transcription factor bHLH95-like [Henckelia pumila]|uniref:transcription factor bHLH95-like n=1 Tax=Henckelia pumila TaxID=405737 RepID=UPI003C6E4005
MAEVHGSHDDSLSWDDQTWSFPNLVTNDTQISEKKPATKISKVSPPAAKGRKRSTAARKGGTGGGDKDDDNENGGRESEHELHIWTERERRKKMRNMFANLHALLPHLPPKADKSTIVDEAINYIRKMQRALQNLEKKKVQKLHHGITNPTTNDPFRSNRQNLGLIRSRETFLADQGPAPAAARNSAVPQSNHNFRSPMLVPGSDQFPAFFKTWTSPNVTLSVCGEDAHISVCGPRKPGLLTAICFVMEKYGMEVVAAQASSDADRCMYMFHAHTNNVGCDQFPEEEICKQAAAEILSWLI